MRKYLYAKTHAFFRHIFNFSTKILTDRQYLTFRYLLNLRRIPNLNNPKLQNEKITWRMLNDRRPLLRTVSDKLAVREYVNEKGLKAILPNIIFVTSDPFKIPMQSLPIAFVVKGSHGSGMIMRVPDKNELNMKRLYRTCQQWLDSDYYFRAREWQYRDLPRNIMVEEFLGGGKTLPLEYKLHCFDGIPRVIRVNTARNTPKARKFWFDPDWNLQEFGSNVGAKSTPAKPKQLEEMIDVSRKLSSDFDYVRVDLYAISDRVVFSEMTLTQGAGISMYPTGLDELLGSFWSFNKDLQ